MVWLKNVGLMPAYVCDSCGLGYRNAKIALQCEEFCNKNKSCSVELVRKAVYKP